MRRSVLATIAVAVLLVCTPLRADDLVFRLFGDYLEALRAQSGIPGLSAAVVGDNDILWERAFVQQDLERSIATRSDTPFHVDGLTQIFTASMVLRCVEDGQLSLDDRVAQYSPASPDAAATLRQILTHTSGAPDNPIFSYHPERLTPLASAIQACTGTTYRTALTALLERFAMIDSVPGQDAVKVLVPPADDAPTQDQLDRYASVLLRLAKPYAVDLKGRAAGSQYSTTALTPAGGLISTTRDFAKFDLALRKGVVVRPETLAASWQPPVGRNGLRLPHAIGWFVQTYKNETVLWQFGLQDNASSSLVIKLPGRGLTLVLLANGDGLIKAFAPTAGDVTISPFGRVFLGLFIR